MEKIAGFVLPAIILIIIVFGLIKKVRVFDCFIKGASSGLETAAKLLAPLTALTLAVAALVSSGALSVITRALAPASRITGIPEGVLPLTALSPASGSGSLTMFEHILKEFGPDSAEGRIASVIMGSTETTFYAATVYYGAVGIRKSGCTLPAALLADATSFILSSASATLFIR